MKQLNSRNGKKRRFTTASLRGATKHGSLGHVKPAQGLSRDKGRRPRSHAFSPKSSGGLGVTARHIGTNNGDGRLSAVKQFEAAVRHFQRQNYDKAAEILERLAATAPPEIADRARVHLRLCERRRLTVLPPRTAADSYLFGVAELNAGRPDSAANYLEKANRMEPGREDVCYALAACYALQAKASAALDLLKTAIGLRPQNRLDARHDPAFQSLAGDPRFGDLVRPKNLQPRPAAS